jgi:hypothetical protein
MKKIKEIDCDSSDIIQEIKQDYCICRKNKVQGLYEQCTNKKKYGDFCGKHAKSKEKLLVSESLPANLKKYITFSSYQNLGDKVLNNSTNLELINTLRNYKLKTNDYSKNNMVNLVQNHFQLLLQYSSDDKIQKIKKIQNLIKDYIQNKEIRLRGPAYQNRILCNNTDDFLTFEEIENIPDKYFFSFKDKDNFIYGFDIRSFNKLIECNMDNPYNRNKIPKQAINNLKSLINNPKYNLVEIQNGDITKEQKMNQRVISVFQKIDELDSYAGGTNIDWFLNLSSNQLKLYYKVLEDIWNYRSELSNSRKNEIVPNKKMFPISVHSFYNLNEKRKMRKIILNEMEKLVSTAPKREDRVLGSYYTLIGLVEVSPQVATALPWLVQV